MAQAAQGNVLVVDDEASVLATMQTILEMDGFVVTTASGGRAALDLIRAREFDLVLTDLRLEDVDGLEVLGEIRRTSPDTVAIMLTGYASLESAVQALREGAYDYLLKPCRVDELKATVARGIERHHLTQALDERMAQLERANTTIQRMNLDLERRVGDATAELNRRVEELARARDELQELDRLKSQFLSMASHELKTPLTAISGFLQLTLRRARRRLQRGRPEQAEWQREQQAQVDQLETVNSQTTRLARLVDELLDVSRIESGTMEIRSAPVNLHRLAQGAVARMQLTTTRHTITLASAIDDAFVQGDRDYLEQVLTNLISNAIKYSPRGGDIALGLDREGSDVLLSVRDPGIGIPADEIETIFDLFYRSRDSSARPSGAAGMGLGLYISKEIVVRHGGQIWAESVPGKGSIFFVSLPKAAAGAAEHGDATAFPAGRAPRAAS